MTGHLPRPAFWMVARQPRHAGSKTEPRQRYSTEAEARAVAARLATETGEPHVILAAVAIVRPGEGTPTLL